MTSKFCLLGFHLWRWVQFAGEAVQLCRRCGVEREPW